MYVCVFVPVGSTKWGINFTRNMHTTEWHICPILFHSDIDMASPLFKSKKSTKTHGGSVFNLGLERLADLLPKLKKNKGVRKDNKRSGVMCVELKLTVFSGLQAPLIEI